MAEQLINDQLQQKRLRQMHARSVLHQANLWWAEAEAETDPVRKQYCLEQAMSRMLGEREQISAAPPSEGT
jgi:hypothetical protein